MNDKKKQGEKPTETPYERGLRIAKEMGVKIVENKTGKISSFIGTGNNNTNRQ